MESPLNSDRPLISIHKEYASAVDFVDRAIFTYERAFIGAFTLTSGLNRLDFDHVENRPFYLAIHRQLAYVLSDSLLDLYGLY